MMPTLLFCASTSSAPSAGGNAAGRSLKRERPALMIVRRRPTLPHRLQCSTIGAEWLDFRVRNVTGYFPFAVAAETLLRYQDLGGPVDRPWANQLPPLVPDRISGTSQWTRGIFVRNKPPGY